MGSAVLNSAGQPAQSSSIRIREWQRRGKRKCSDTGFCEGLTTMIVDSGNQIAALQDDKYEETGRPVAAGLLHAETQQLLLFNFCPACGARMRLEANG
jgi:hypothetical protein